MQGISWTRMLVTIGLAIAATVIVFATHPGWFRATSTFVLPRAPSTPTPNLTPAPPARPKPVPTVPRVGMAQHLDDIWVTPWRVDHSQGTHGMAPNLGDEFLIVHILIRNRSQVTFPVQLRDFVVLDSHGQLDPPLTVDFTRRRLREVQLIPQGYTIGTLIFEVPRYDPAATLIYQPDILDLNKRKEWLLR